MTYRIFLSSVQREFAKERKALAIYIRKDATKSRDWNDGKSRDLSIVKTFEDKEESDNFTNGDVVKSRDRKVTKSRDRRSGLTTQQTTQETTQQISNRRLLQLVPPWNMRNIVSLVMKNPHLNIDGMAAVLGLSPNGIKYHIKRLRTLIKFKHVGALQAGHWEIGPKETP